MIKILTNADRDVEKALFRQMFEARAVVFHDRLGWDVQVKDGMETDRYDDLEHVLYVMTLDDRGQATSSLRLLPTTGETMLKNEFANFFSEPVDVISPTIVECTRFVVHPSPEDRPTDLVRAASSDLLIGLCEMCLANGFEHVMGLYEVAMHRVYRRIGWSPDVLAESRSKHGHLRVGLWEASEEALTKMRVIAQSHRMLGEVRHAA